MCDVRCSWLGCWHCCQWIGFVNLNHFKRCGGMWLLGTWGLSEKTKDQQVVSEQIILTTTLRCGRIRSDSATVMSARVRGNSKVRMCSRWNYIICSFYPQKFLWFLLWNWFSGLWAIQYKFSKNIFVPHSTGKSIRSTTTRTPQGLGQLFLFFLRQIPPIDVCAQDLNWWKAAWCPRTRIIGMLTMKTEQHPRNRVIYCIVGLNIRVSNACARLQDCRKADLCKRSNSGYSCHRQSAGELRQQKHERPPLCRQRVRFRLTCSCFLRRFDHIRHGLSE